MGKDEAQPIWGDATVWRSFSRWQLDRPLLAALDEFSANGYHGTSMRLVASRAKSSIATVYHHYPSKQALLCRLMDYALAELQQRCDSALHEAGDDALARLGNLVECLVLFHAHRQRPAFLVLTERRALEEPARSDVLARRRAIHALFDGCIKAAADQELLSVEAPELAARAIVAMCVSINFWYRDGGTLTPEELASQYRGYALGMVGATARL